MQPKPIPYCGAVTEQSSMTGVAASPLAIVKLAEQHAQRLVAASNSYSNALAEFVPALHRTDCHPAYLVVGAVCLNDFNDLLFDAVSGRGRSAHRSARTVFEHLLKPCRASGAVASDTVHASHACRDSAGGRLESDRAALVGEGAEGLTASSNEAAERQPQGTKRGHR